MRAGGDGARTRGEVLGPKNSKNQENQAIRAGFTAPDGEEGACGLTEPPATMIYGEVGGQL